MKKLLSILGATTLTIVPVTTILNNSTNMELKANSEGPLLLKNNIKEKENLSTGDVVENINLQLETKAVGKAWGVGSANAKPFPGEIEIDLTEFGGKYLFQNTFKEVLVDIKGEYFFQKGKDMNWDNYYKEKLDYTASRAFNWDVKEGMNQWTQLKYAESDKGGYKSKNYYKSEALAEFKGLNKLVIKLKYTISAYGVGSNWYWSAGTVSAPKVTFIAR